MRISIDNLAGAGALDYTGSIDAVQSVQIKRMLNEPSECTFAFLPDAQNLPLPLRYARVTVTDSSGLVLFTGYVSSPPAMVLVGAGATGISYRAVVTAISDEILLDSMLSAKAGTALNQPITQTIETLTSLAGATINLSSASSGASVGRYEAKAATKWSTGVGALASSARTAYRVLGGVTSVTGIGNVIHALNEEDGTLQLGGLSASAVRLLANDITVCGKIEPAAYVTEIFQGDGVTTVFTMTNLPFEPLASEKLSFDDLFQSPSLNGQVWQWSDSGSRLSITSSGLTCSGGTGGDGQTTVSALHEIEVGGSVMLEAGGVQITPGSQGLLLGLYAGTVLASNCFAGFQVTQVNGATQIAPLVDGSQAGTPFVPVSGHLYTLRLRVYSAEMERVLQSYFYLGANGTGAFGGQVVVGAASVVMEVQDVTGGIAGIINTLYEGAVQMAPPACKIGLINSGSLACSVKTFTCVQSSPVWVTVVPQAGAPMTQIVDTAANGGVCKIASTGILTFYAANVPPAGALIYCNYRARHRAAARRSILQGAGQPGVASAVPATQMWVGTVTEPAAWSSVDCDNAAAALLQSSATASAAWTGTYTTWNLDLAADVWPGDVLAINSASAGLNVSVVVREVQVEMGCSAPQMVKYIIRFANEWAEDLAIKLSATVPTDAWLPATAAAGGTSLNNLAGLTVTAVSGSQILVDAGLMPPAGGGFEVKRRDWTFGPGVDSDLVLRSPVTNFSIPREAPMEQYYVRMYDGSTPPNYSQMSSGIFVNVPLSGD